MLVFVNYLLCSLRLVIFCYDMPLMRNDVAGSGTFHFSLLLISRYILLSIISYLKTLIGVWLYALSFTVLNVVVILPWKRAVPQKTKCS